MSIREEAFCGSLTGEAGPGGEQGGDMTVVPREGTESLADSSNLKGSNCTLGACSWTGSACSSTGGSGDASCTWSKLSGVGSLMGSGVGSRTGSGVGSRRGSGVGSCTGSGGGSDISAADGTEAISAGGSACSGPATTAAAVAIATAAATAAAISFSDSAATAGLGPRFTGVGVLLPTVFFGLEVLVADVLEAGVLEASLEGVGLLSLRMGVFVSAALLAIGFLVVTSDFEADLGVSGLDFVEEGRVRGDSAGFLDAGVAGLVTSFLTGVVVLGVCDPGSLPPEGVVEVGLGAAGLAVVEGVLGVAGLAVAVELLAVLADSGRVEPVAGRGDAPVLVGVLVVLETGGLGEAAELGLVGVAEAGFGARGFLAAVAVVLDLTPLAVVDGVFLAAVPVADFALLVFGPVPVAFFSPTLVVVLEAGAPAVPVGFLDRAEVGVLFLSAAGVVFFATPLV